jgi:hypothetical protein
MRNRRTRSRPILIAAGLTGAIALSPQVTKAHEVHAAQSAPSVERLPVTTEGEAPKGVERPSTGRGRWTFVAVTEGVLTVPAEALPRVKGAHGTLVVDRERDIVYWGLEQVGWVAFSDRLTRSRVIKGDPALQRGNLHGADLLPRDARPPLVAAVDNVEGEVYLSDTSFQRVQKVAWPNRAPYEEADQYHPTDVAFVSDEELYVTDGYGAAHFMAMDVDPLAYRGEIQGGKWVSRTPHGITWDAENGSLVISARPEGQIKRWSTDSSAFNQVLGLPPGSTVCDIDIRGDYALAPCLNGPDNSPGPIYIINLRERTLVSTLQPKVDLEFDLAQHIHDATWYEADGELYVLFTNWNPGGIGAMRLVR